MYVYLRQEYGVVLGSGAILEQAVSDCRHFDRPVRLVTPGAFCTLASTGLASKGPIDGASTME